MNQTSIYLDNSATTRPYDEVIALMKEVMEEDYGNPSSLHRMGLLAEERIEAARKLLADSLGAFPEEIVFTSGGTEADNMAVLFGAEKKKRRGNKVLVSTIEHPAVLEPAKRLEEEGCRVVYLPVDETGVIRKDVFEKENTEDVILISLMHVNNEVGSIQPIRWVGERKGSALFHVDMVQSFGKLPIHLSGELSAVDMATVSGHKIHGPKGIGCLYMRKGLEISPLILGGGQEKNRRSGTENVPAIAGLGLAAAMINENREEKNKVLYDIKMFMETFFREEMKDTLLNSTGEGAPHIVSVSFPGVRGEVILHTLEQEGVFVSTGSACSSHKKSGSHVIKALGRSDKEVEGTIRFSLSDSTTMEEAKTACQKTKEAVERFRLLGSFR